MEIAAPRSLRKWMTFLIWRFAPIAAIVTVLSYIISNQIVQPQHRMIKAGVLLVVLGILMKFAMIYSLYFFVIMFPFPSGIVVTSTNVLLLTLITLIWIVRARATNQRLFDRTNVDLFNVLFLLSFILSLFNVETTYALSGGIKLIWRQITAFCLFYLIATFVDDENKLERMTQAFAISGGLVALTGIVELFAPGFVLIPGWIEFNKPAGMGMLGYRVHGIRVGGAVGAHNILSDYCAFSIFFMVINFLRAKNPIGKTFWLSTTIMTFAVLLATANRGGVLSFMFAFLYALWVFRRYLNLVTYVIVITTAVAVFGLTQLVLDRYTVAASVTHRLVGTEFHGVVPDTRTGIWSDTIEASLDHIVIGHGPLFQPARGLRRVFWPHNGYLYYLYTLGIFGLSMFLVIAYRLFKSSLRYYHSLASGTYLGLAMAVLNVMLGMFLVGQLRTDHQRDTDYVYIYIVWILFGLVAAAGNMLDRRIREAAQRAAPVEAADAGPQLP